MTLLFASRDILPIVSINAMNERTRLATRYHLRLSCVNILILQEYMRVSSASACAFLSFLLLYVCDYAPPSQAEGEEAGNR